MMSPECFCTVCVGRRRARKTPHHLKAYDDTSPSATGHSTTPTGATDIKMATMISGCDCCCKSCMGRRAVGKKPVHLKAYDDTAGTVLDLLDAKDEGLIFDAWEPCLGCGMKMFHEPPTFEAWMYDPFTPYCPGCRRRMIHPICECEGCWGEDALCRAAMICPQSKDIFNQMFLLSNGVGLDYKLCSPKALKHLVQRRSLKDPYPPGLTLRYLYVQVLEDADQAPRFRLADLPPEIRNRVYENLLAVSPFRYHSYPEILATCHQIHDEATGILYAEYNLPFSVRCEYPVDKNFLCADVGLHNTHWSYIESQGNQSVFDICEPPNNSRLRELAALDLDISQYAAGLFHQHRNDGFRTRGAIQNALLTIASSLIGSPRLKKVKITFFLECFERASSISEDDLRWAEMMLYPLRRLRGIQQVKICGNCPADVAESIARDMRSNKPAFNTLEELRRVQALLDSYLEFIRLHLEDYAGQSAQLDELLTLAQLTPFDDADNRALVIDEEHEMQLRAEIVEKEKMLEELGPAEGLLSRFTHTR